MAARLLLDRVTTDGRTSLYAWPEGEGWIVDDRELAMEEMKIAQGIIQSRAEAGLRVRGWCITLVTVLAAAKLGADTDVSGVAFILGALSLIVIFFWLDSVHRVSEDRLIERSHQIEASLRGESAYDGPGIGRALQRTNTVRDQLGASRNIRVWGPYVALAAVILVVGLAF